MKLRAALLFIAACVPPTLAERAPPPQPQPLVKADPCLTNIPDCEAACAMREANRTTNIDWFDRRCAAVVLGRNPDKAVGYTPPVLPPTNATTSATATATASASTNCDPPFSYDSEGIKRWKRECN